MGFYNIIKIMEKFKKVLKHIEKLNEDLPTGFVDYRWVNGDDVIYCNLKFMTDQSQMSRTGIVLEKVLDDIAMIAKKYDNPIDYRFIVRHGELKFIESTLEIAV
tara:strand:+ start:4259 stop:4570 length:312 start_codon:yes stop_codon:yes gene_type:complete